MTEANIKMFFDPETHAFSYVVWDHQSRQAIIIDSVYNYDATSGRCTLKSANELIAFVETNQLEVKYALETHVHADHLSAASYLKKKLACKTGIGCHIDKIQAVFGPIFNAGSEFKTDGSQFDCLFSDGENIQVGKLNIKIIHTPGHTPVCTSYLIGNAIFVGDTLFMPDYGTARTDFPGGSAQTLYHSIQKILLLPEATNIYLCHDYGTPERSEMCHQTSVAIQKQNNIHINNRVSEAEFIQTRESRDAKLSAPKLLYPSVQFNMRAGKFPTAEENGKTYFKIPLNF